MYYMNLMDRDQIKSAIINCATTHSISLSELATEAGIAPATLTGFVNDSKSGNRDRHTLSMTTIGKLTKRWPDLADHLKVAIPLSNVKQVPYIGMVDRFNDWMVGGLEPGRPGSLMMSFSNPDWVAYGIKEGHPIIRNRVYLCKPEPVYEKFEDHINTLVIVDGEFNVVTSDKASVGRYIGYLCMTSKGEFWLAVDSGNDPKESKQAIKFCDCTKIKWLQPVEWIRP